MNADDVDIVALRADLLTVEGKLTAAKARYQRWANKAAAAIEPADAQRKSQALHWMQDAAGRVAQLEAQMRKIEEESMRHVDDDSGAPVVNPALEFYAYVTLTIGDTRYPRGATIEDEVAIGCGNDLIERRYIRQRQRGSRFARSPQPAPVAPVVSTPVMSADHIRDYAFAVAGVVTERGCDWATAEDHVLRANGDLYLKAQKQFCDEPRRTQDGAWGSGGGNKQLNGTASSGRRIFNQHEFRERLRSIVAPQRQDSAA